MFIEVRVRGKKKKYYLVHSYRKGGKVRRISRYLGTDLKKDEINKLKTRAEELINEQLKEENNPLSGEVSQKELEYFKKMDAKIEVAHLHGFFWERFSEEFSYHVNAIEGSTVSPEETRNIVEKKKVPKTPEEIEALNVAKAINYVRKKKRKLSIMLIKKLHKICFEGTKPFAGQFRDKRVVVKDGSGKIIHEGAPAENIKYLLREMCSWYEKYKETYPALLLAAVVHNQFEKIHPFADGNGRVGRILLNFVLLDHDYPPLNIMVQDRSDYYKCIMIFNEKGDIKPTLRFMISQYRKGQGNVSTKMKM